ncbi:MAG: amino acid adenylation domain-containing protein, partial [Acidobacteriota bacterium]
MDEATERPALTRVQRLILTGQRLHPGVPLYNQAFAFTVSGPLDPQRFSRAWTATVGDCDALRTVVDNADDPEPSLRVLAAEDVSLDFGIETVDLTGESDPDGAATTWLNARCARRFELGGRLVDTALLQLGDDRWIWYLCQHHAVTDAWSVQVIFRRVSQRYLEPEADQPPIPSGDPVPAADGTAEPTAADRAAAEHWRSFAETDHRPPPLYGRSPRTTASRRLDVDLGAERTEALRRLARRPETGALSLDLGLFNLFATLLFAYQHRIGDASDLELGAPFHNRATPAQAAMAGLMIEVFPLRVRVEPGDRFVDLLTRVRAASVDFLRHAGPGRGDAAQNRGFHTVLNYIRGGFGTFAGLPTSTRWLHPGHHDREHALRLHVHDLDATGRLSLQVDLDDGVFGPEVGPRAVEHLLNLIDALLADWDRPVDDVPLVGADESSRLLELARGGPITHAPASVVDAVLAQAERQPGAVAVAVRGAVALTYGDLDRRSAQLAAALHGAGPFVGLRLPRSAAAVVAMLGILRSGRAYVPLDPAWPADRLDWALGDAGIKTVVSDDPEPVEDASILQVNLDGSLRGPEPSSELGAAPTRSPHRPAYLLYTSGSTGRPKGVVVAHRSLAAYVAWAAERYAVGASTPDTPLSWPLFSPLTFDLTVTSVFVPLVSGGRIVVYPEGDQRADLAFLDVVADDAVDVIKLTPSHLGLLRDRRPGGGRVKRLIFGGEALRRDVAARAHALFGDGVTIHNEYGPTEATVGCVEHAFDASREGTAGDVPIGRPIDGASSHILDRRGRPVPDGVQGELYLGGDGLAAGYLGRPALTAERFLPDPFPGPDDAVGGRRLYRSGDRARRGRDGALHYLGRTDLQIKVRGVRVEPGEIEAAIKAHPGVDTAVVGLVGDAPPDTPTIPDEPLVHCRDCGLPSDFPGTTYDENGVCNHCRAFVAYRPEVERYFRDPNDLRARLDPVRDARGGATDRYDCLSLLSGGKDSTYAAARLVDMGYRVLTFTLDNGFLSEQAMDNVRRVVDHLGVDHVFGSTPAMNRIFADSLERYSNVCQGCFKTLYTLSLGLARDKGIPFIVTGLSRGQLFETRLTPELFTDLDFDPETIDRTVLEARKAYHRTDDAVSRLLDVRHTRDDTTFDEVEFLDFYRYVDVGLDEMYTYLDERVPWIRPTDTGRSTNCLINDLGIWVHRRERGFHNYALPYSWDVRMGHKTREAALHELDDEIDEEAVRRMLDEVGYTVRNRRDAGAETQRLVAWYTPAGDAPATADSLRDFAAERLPDFLLPGRFMQLGEIPLTANGKVDRRELETLARGASGTPDGDGGSPPRTPVEHTLARIWGEVLGVSAVGRDDDFYGLGGDSILAIRIAARGHREGLGFEPAELFDAPTVAQLARRLTERSGPELAASVDDAGPTPLLPSQRWCLDHLPSPAEPWHQVLRLRLDDGPGSPFGAATFSSASLDRALRAVVDQHAALRTRFSRAYGRWGAEVLSMEDLADGPWVRAAAGGERAAAERALAEDLGARMAAGAAPLVGAVLTAGDDGSRTLTLTAHHLVVDALSWPILLDDLAAACRAVADGSKPSPAPAGSLAAWGRALENAAQSPAVDAERSHWIAAAEAAEPLPSRVSGDGIQGDPFPCRRLSLDPHTSAGLTGRPSGAVPPAFAPRVAATPRTGARWSP